PGQFCTPSIVTIPLRAGEETLPSISLLGRGNAPAEGRCGTVEQVWDVQGVQDHLGEQTVQGGSAGPLQGEAQQDVPGVRIRHPRSGRPLEGEAFEVAEIPVTIGGVDVHRLPGRQAGPVREEIEDSDARRLTLW